MRCHVTLHCLFSIGFSKREVRIFRVTVLVKPKLQNHKTKTAKKTIGFYIRGLHKTCCLQPMRFKGEWSGLRGEGRGWRSGLPPPEHFRPEKGIVFRDEIWIFLAKTRRCHVTLHCLIRNRIFKAKDQICGVAVIAMQQLQNLITKDHWKGAANTHSRFT